MKFEHLLLWVDSLNNCSSAGDSTELYEISILQIYQQSVATGRQTQRWKFGVKPKVTEIVHGIGALINWLSCKFTILAIAPCWNNHDNSQSELDSGL
jgi:hypothetical protein